MAATRIAKRKRTSPADPDEKLYWKMRRTGPALTRAQAYKFEKMEQDPKLHYWRRAAFAILSTPCEELFGKIEGDRKTAVTFTKSAQGISDYAKAVRVLVEFLYVAQLRIEIGLCKREDYDEVLAEAKVEPKASKRLHRLSGAGAANG